MQVFSFTNRISKKQYTDYFLYKELRKPRRIALLVCGVLFFTRAMLAVLGVIPVLGASKWPVLELMVPGFVILLFVVIRMKVRTSYENQKGQISNVLYTISDEGIAAQSDGSSSITRWSAIMRVADQKP